MNPHDPDTSAPNEHDAWLSHALRHAPDANADAPTALSDAILRSARTAVARPVDAPATPATATAAPTAPTAPTAPRRRRRSHPFLSAWAWLAQPPVAAGFGSVMVATLVGVLWWGRSLDEALPRAPAPALASTPVPVLAPRQAQAETSAPTMIAAAPAAMPTASPRPSPTSSNRRADKAPPDARAARREASQPAAANETEPTPVLQIPPPAAAGEPSRETPQDATPSLADARARASSAPLDATLTRAFAGAASGTAAHAAAGRAGPARASTAPGSADAALTLLRPADAGRAPLAALLAAIAREPERWRWQRAGSAGEALAMTSSLLRWLAELDRATASQWRKAADGAARDGPPTLRLLRDGLLQATLGFGAGVWIETAAASAPDASTATLPAASIEALKKTLDEATR